MAREKRRWIPIALDQMEPEGPYQCPECGGHVILDATYLEQVKLNVKCPYCGKSVWTSGEYEESPGELIIVQAPIYLGKQHI